MSLGKSKSKEDTWTEKDLADAIQGNTAKLRNDAGRDSHLQRKKHSKHKGADDMDGRHEKSERYKGKDLTEFNVTSGSLRTGERKNRKQPDDGDGSLERFKKKMEKREKEDIGYHDERFQEKNRKHEKYSKETSGQKERRLRDDDEHNVENFDRQRSKEKPHKSEEDQHTRKREKDKRKESEQKLDGDKKHRDERKHGDEKRHESEKSHGDESRHYSEKRRVGENSHDRERRRDSERNHGSDRRKDGERRHDGERRLDGERRHDGERKHEGGRRHNGERRHDGDRRYNVEESNDKKVLQKKGQKEDRRERKSSRDEGKATVSEDINERPFDGEAKERRKMESHHDKDKHEKDDSGTEQRLRDRHDSYKDRRKDPRINKGSLYGNDIRRLEKDERVKDKSGHRRDIDTWHYRSEGNRKHRSRVDEEERKKGKRKISEDGRGRQDEHEFNEDKKERRRDKDEKHKEKQKIDYNEREKTDKDNNLGYDEGGKKRREKNNRDYDPAKQKDTRSRNRLESLKNDKKERKSSVQHQINNDTLANKNATEVDEDIQNEDSNENYEDDFEDYEDDFEDDDEDDDEDIDIDDDQSENREDKGKLLEIFEAINAENNDIRSVRKKDVEIIEKSKNNNNGEQHGRINFFAAKQKHATDIIVSKTKKRAKELLHLIELDVASFDIFDLPPLNEYELYIKSYGQSDCKQAYVQCREDVIEKELQTDFIETRTKWTQYPPDDFKGSGDDDENPNELNLQEQDFTTLSFDSIRLTNFLQQAGQVCLILLEEKVSARKDVMFKEKNDLNISDGFIQLARKLSFLEGRRILDMKFNSVQTHLLLTAHDDGENSTEEDCLARSGIVCYWNVNEPSRPQKILLCESWPNACCFSPLKSSLVFAGLDDGSVVVWDVRESSSLHKKIKIKDHHWIVRRPTFSTAGVLFNENHLSPVICILPITRRMDSPQALPESSSLQDDFGGIAFQIASMDESGTINIWVVVEFDRPDEAGSENDLGLIPGGRVKLIKTTSIIVPTPQREMFFGHPIQASVVQLSNFDTNIFHVGTDRGWVVNCSRFGNTSHPRLYRPRTDTFVTVSTLDVSPWNIPVMLVGCMDGTLRLHDLRKENPVLCWSETTQGSPIVQIMWSKCRPSLFFVLDAEATLYIWDLLNDDRQPMLTETFKRGKLLSFSMSNDYECLGVGLPGRKSELVLNFDCNVIELHRLKENLSQLKPDDVDSFSNYVDSII